MTKTRSISIIGGGTTATSSCTITEGQLELYPDPCADQLVVTGSIGPYYIEVLNAAGEVTKTTYATHNAHAIDTSTLPAGLYLVRYLNLNNELLEVRKVIKE